MQLTTKFHKIKTYVSNDNVAKSIFTDSSTNKYIIKGSTGIGGTSSVFTITNESRILISPLLGMIASKEFKREAHHMFIYGTSSDSWGQWYERIQKGEKIILNTTPEQVLMMKNHNAEIYNAIIKISFVIDEWDIFATAEYRDMLAKFLPIIFNELENGIILTTATPIYKHLELPKSFLKTLEFHHISREVEPIKKITLAPSANYFNFIKEEADKGNKVVLFTNDVNRIKNIINNPELGYKVQTLVGDLLSSKLSKVKTKTIEEYDLLKESKIDEEAQIYILSTKYLIGFDIEFDASIGIFADEMSKVDASTVNEIRQAYGRVRNTVTNAKLFYRQAPKPEGYEAIPLGHLEYLANQIEFEGNDEYLKEKNVHIKNITNQLTYNKTNLINELTAAGFEVTEERELIATQSIRLPFNQQYRNIAQGDDYIATADLNIVMNHIKGDLTDYNGFSKKSLLLYSVGYLAAYTGNQYLLNADPQRYERLLEIGKIFIDVNRVETNAYAKISRNKATPTQLKYGIDNGAKCGDSFEFNLKYTTNDTFQKAILIIDTLYQIEKNNNQEFDEETLAVINGFRIASECVINDFKKAVLKYEYKSIDEILGRNDYNEITSLNNTINGLNKKVAFKHTDRDIEKQLQDLEGITPKIQGQIMKKANDIKQSLLKNKNGVKATLKSNTYTINKQLEHCEYYLLSLLSLQCSGHMFGFKVTTKDNRDFNTVTKCTRQLRKYTPYKMYEADIKSAFASIIDVMIGSKLAPVLYQNIMKAYNVERDEAKVMYNAALNDATRSRPELVKFFTKCGYDIDQVKKIVILVTVDKGSFYRSMTKKEEEIIKKFKYMNELGPTAIRCHDALYWPAINNKPTILTIDGIEFDVN